MDEPKARANGGRARRWLGLGALLLLSLLLRAWALTWGLPDAGRYYPYHPDEAVLLDAVAGTNPLWGDFTPGLADPGFYNYGSLTILVTRLAYDLLSPFLGWGTVPRLDQPFPMWVEDFSRLLLLGRWITVLFGVGTVALVWGLGRVLYGPRAGWLAAGFTAVAPILVVLGHYLTVDVPTTFFTTLTLLCAALALRAELPRKKLLWIAAAGAVAGLAAGTKYNGVLAGLAVLPALWSFRRAEGRSLPWIGASVVCAAAAAAAAFVVSTPGVLLDTQTFLGDLTYELGRNREGQGLVFRATPPAPLYHLGISLPVGLEWPLYLLALAGTAWALWRRRAEEALLLLFLVPFFLALAPAERKFVRYVAPLVPVLALLAAALVDRGLRRGPAPVWAAWAGIAAAAALASSIAHLGVMAAPDARDRAAEWLREHAERDDLIALAADPWYYTPPVHPTTGSVKISLGYGGPPEWDRTQGRPDVVQLESFRMLAPGSVPPEGPLSPEKLRQYRPDYVVMADFEYEDPERIRRAEPGFRHPILALEAALAEEGYEVVQELRPRPRLLGFTWWKHGIPPHDWRYFMPLIRIYGRR
ncbi:MAG: ArnT family glycosyltransferase [Armatimonadota bacterium]